MKKILIMLIVIAAVFSSYGFALYVPYDGYSQAYPQASYYTSAYNYPAYYYQPYISGQQYPCYNTYCPASSNYYTPYLTIVYENYPLPSASSAVFCEDPGAREGEIKTLGVNPKADYICVNGKWRYLRPSDQYNSYQYGIARNKAEFYNIYGYQGYLHNYPSTYTYSYNYSYPSQYPAYTSYQYAPYSSSQSMQTYVSGASINNMSYTIEAYNNYYSPSTLYVRKGTAVRWINLGSQNWPASDNHPTHTLYPGSDASKCGTTQAANIFDACRILERGDSYYFTFNEIGTWTYHNHLNPSVKGTVVVEA